MQIGLAIHSNEDLLEQYAFGRLPEEQTALIEEHLFVCEHCLERLSEIDNFIQATRTAASELERQKTRPSGFRALLSGRWWQVPKPMWAVGFAALLVCLLIPFRPPSQSATPTEVRLVASRGTDLVAHGNSSSPLLLHIEAGRLAPQPAYRIEVINAEGSPVWKTQAAPTGDRLTALMPRPLASGTYWVRVYGASDPAKQLQEYQLEIP